MRTVSFDSALVDATLDLLDSIARQAASSKLIGELGDDIETASSGRFCEGSGQRFLDEIVVGPQVGHAWSESTGRLRKDQADLRVFAML